MVLAILGLVRVRRGRANNPVIAAIGAALSAASIIVTFVMFAAFVNAVDDSGNEFNQEIERIEQELNTELDCICKLGPPSRTTRTRWPTADSAPRKGPHRQDSNEGFSLAGFWRVGQFRPD